MRRIISAFVDRWSNVTDISGLINDDAIYAAAQKTLSRMKQILGQIGPINDIIARWNDSAVAEISLSRGRSGGMLFRRLTPLAILLVCASPDKRIYQIAFIGRRWATRFF